MIFRQYYLDCLSQTSHLVGDETTRKAVVVDPRRGVAEYLADARTHRLQIHNAGRTRGDSMDASGWDERYAAAGLVWSGGPNRTVAAEVDGLEAGTALDLGAGEGRNALWLAEQGWTVTAVDFSAVGLEKARAIARRRGLPVTTVVADVTCYDPEQSYDLVLLAYLQLPSTALQEVLATAAAALAPGGTFLLIAHDLLNLTEGVGGPQDPAVLQTPDQVTTMLPGLRVEKAERVRRPVEIDGTTRHAIDTLVRARALP